MGIGQRERCGDGEKGTRGDWSFEKSRGLGASLTAEIRFLSANVRMEQRQV